MATPRELPELPAPFNWCDGRCESCYLAPTCKLHQELVGLRSTRDLAQRRVEPIPLEVLEPVGPIEPVEPGPERRRARRGEAKTRRYEKIRDTSMHLLKAIDKLFLAGVPRGNAERARAAALVIHVKIARILEGESPSTDPEWLERSAPTLLLIRELLSDLHTCVMEALLAQDRWDGEWAVAWEKLCKLMDPFVRRVPREVSAKVAELVRRHQAPSPFLRKPPTGDLQLYPGPLGDEEDDDCPMCRAMKEVEATYDEPDA